MEVAATTIDSLLLLFSLCFAPSVTSVSRFSVKALVERKTFSVGSGAAGLVEKEESENNPRTAAL